MRIDRWVEFVERSVYVTQMESAFKTVYVVLVVGKLLKKLPEVIQLSQFRRTFAKRFFVAYLTTS